MSDWEPSDHHPNATVNAILNVAESISALASATNGLLYGLKYSREKGLSLAEAIEVSAEKVARAIESHSDE
jgi:hypothetical protein